jgi:hypothetical protein
VGFWVGSIENGEKKENHHIVSFSCFFSCTDLFVLELRSFSGEKNIQALVMKH